MSQELFQSTLREENEGKLKSYNLEKLYLVAFFGGLIPTVALSIKNALWLRIDRRWTIFMGGTGVIYLLSKVYFVSYYVPAIIQQGHDSQTRMTKYIFRAITLLISVLFIRIMNKQYRRQQMFGGEFQPILKDAIIWTLIGTIIEVIVILLGGFVFGKS